MSTKDVIARELLAEGSRNRSDDSRSGDSPFLRDDRSVDVEILTGAAKR